MYNQRLWARCSLTVVSLVYKFARRRVSDITLEVFIIGTAYILNARTNRGILAFRREDLIQTLLERTARNINWFRCNLLYAAKRITYSMKIRRILMNLIDSTRENRMPFLQNAHGISTLKN